MKMPNLDSSYHVGLGLESRDSHVASQALIRGDEPPIIASSARRERGMYMYDEVRSSIVGTTHGMTCRCDSSVGCVCSLQDLFVAARFLITQLGMQA